MDRLDKLMNSGRMIVSAWTGMQDPLYLTELARTGFDAVTLDMQHGMQSENSVIRGIAAVVPSGKPVIVRIPVGRFDLVSRALDAGAHGIIAPMINTVEDAQRLVSFAKYLPEGDRSYGVIQVSGLLGVTPKDYVVSANQNTKVLAMIETAQAVENMGAILDLDGIDGIFCGPGDLSISIRQNVVPDAYGPDTIDIIKSMPVEAKKRGKLAYTWCGIPAHVELANELGFDYAALGNDPFYIKNGVETSLGQMAFRK
ncbi:MAG: aldolase/citrate lyase family protein [Rhizobiaceae bacterium]